MSSSVNQVGNSNIQPQNAGSITTAYLPIETYLPREILQRICSLFESAKDVIHFGSTNRYLWVRLSSDAELWTILLYKHFPSSAKHNSTGRPDTESLSLYKQLTRTFNHMKAGKCHRKILDGSQCTVSCIEIADDRRLISALPQGPIEIWDLNTHKKLQTLNGHRDSVSCMIISEDGKRLISCSADSTIKIWDLNAFQEIQTLIGHQGHVTCMAISEDGKQLISGSYDDHTIKIWDLNIFQEIQTVSPDRKPNACMAIEGGKCIFSACDEIKILDLNTFQLRTLVQCQQLITCMEIADGKCIFGSVNTAGLEEPKINICDLDTGQEILTFSGHNAWIICLKSIDGYLISGSKERTIKIWDLKTGKELQTLRGHENGIRHVKFSDGRIISNGWDSKIKIWDFKLPHILEGNLEILGKMAHAEYTHQPKVVQELAQGLEPDVKERLRQHSFKVGVHFAHSKEVILRVQTELCVELLLVAIQNEDHSRVSELLGQLVCIDSENTKIYELLWNICGKPDFYGWGEFAFLNEHGCSASLFHKEQAVLQFKQTLSTRWDHFHLLVNFKIVSTQDYSRELKCRPDHLLKIGILSPADLQALFHFNSPDFQYLQVEEVVVVVDATANPVTVAYDKKIMVSKLLDQLLAAAQQKSDEVKRFSVRRNDEGEVYEVELPNPWDAFQDKIKRKQEDLKKTNNRDKLLEMFDPKSYATLVKEYNALIDEFRTLEQEPEIQFLKLYDYINQWGILAKWNALKNMGIDSLSALLQQKEIAPHDIFNMGE